FCVAAVFAVASLLWNPQWEKRRLPGIVAGLTSVSLAMLAYLRFDFTAILTDLRMAAMSRGGALSRTLIAGILFGTLPEFLILLTISLLLRPGDLKGIRSGLTGSILRYRVPLLTFLVYCGAVLLVATNTQQVRMIPIELLCVLVIDCLTRSEVPG